MKNRGKFYVGRIRLSIKLFIPIFIFVIFFIISIYTDEKPETYFLDGSMIILLGLSVYVFLIPIHSITYYENSQSLLIYGAKILPTSKLVVPLSKIKSANWIPLELKFHNYIIFHRISFNKNAGLYIKTSDNIIKIKWIFYPKKVADRINTLLSQRIEGFKSLHRNMVPGLADSELLDAVMTWLDHKADPQTNDYSLITSLPKPCQYTYACYKIIREINNSNLNLFDFNLTDQLLEIAQAGFKIIGNVKLSDIMQKIYQISQNRRKVTYTYSDRTTGSNLNLNKDYWFDSQVYEAYKEEVPSFISHLILYIRGNQIYFGE